MARPSKYRTEFPSQALKLCRLGATDAELANFFGISKRTLDAWKKAHAEFLRSLKEGKLLADAEVADKLFHRATGYEHEDVDIRVLNGQIVKTPLTKHYPPDTTAAIFWLKNRQPSRWRDKQPESDSDEDSPSLTINFKVKNAIEDVAVTNART